MGRTDLLGRGTELAHLNASLTDVRSGVPRIVLVQGPAGIGKTALIRHFLRGAEGLQVMTATGDEAEATLPYGLLKQLVSEPSLPPPEDLLRLVLDRQSAGDSFTVGAEIVNFVGALQDKGPVAMVVDDVQWADTPSLDALVFALRRLRADRVLALIGLRTQDTSRLPNGVLRLLQDDNVTKLRLSGLDVTAVQQLASLLGKRNLSAKSVQRLHEHTQGNPLYVRTLLEEMAVERLALPKGYVLPALRSFALAVLRRLGECPLDAQRFIGAAAILGMRSSLDVAANLAEVDDPLEALGHAVSRKLLVEQGGSADKTISFDHPLVHAAIYHDVAPASRADLHARAAQLVEDAGVSLHHRVKAAVGKDRLLAGDLTEYAHAQANRGAWADAAAFLVPAARLSPDAASRESLMLEAIEAMIFAGDIPEAARHVELIATFSDSPRRHYTLGLSAYVSGQMAEAAEHLKVGWDAIDVAENVALAERISAYLGSISAQQGRGTEAALWIRRSLELAHGSRLIPSGPLCGLMVALAIAGRTAEGLAVASDLPQHPMSVSTSDIDVLIGRGILRLWSDDLAGAILDLSAVMTKRAYVPLQLLLLTLAYLSEAQYRIGAWDDALINAELGASMADDAAHLWGQPWPHSVAATICSARGEFTRAEDHVRAAVDSAAVIGDVASTAVACTAKAALCHARDDLSGVIDAVDPLLHLVNRDGIDEPGVLPWRETYIDALLFLRRFDEAESALEPFEHVASDRGRYSSLANAARVRGKLEAARGHMTRAQESFETALSHSDHIEASFERALIELDYGGYLRRLGKRRAAVRMLTAAKKRFEDVWARPFLEHCHRELTACGLTRTKRGIGEQVRLTPQEVAVARLVTSGLTNRQVAANLVISTKTVEFHLSNIYAKVGVSSRSHLTARLTESLRFDSGD